MPVLGFFFKKKKFSQVSFSTPENADSKNFPGSKVFYFTSVENIRNFTRVISQNSAMVQNYSNCLLVLEKKNLKCFPSSKM
jgi:hypothetical protein